MDGASADIFDRHRRRLIPAAAAIASCAIFAADALSPIDGAVAVLYTGVVLMAAALGRRTVIATGLVTAMLATIAFLAGHAPWSHLSWLQDDDPLGGATLRYAVSLVAIAITVLLTLRDGSARADLAARMAELQASEQRYSTIFNSAGFAALECDLSAAMRLVREADGLDRRLERRLQSQPGLLREAAGRIRIYNANRAALAMFAADAAGDIRPGELLLAGLPEAEQDVARAALARVFTALAQGDLLVETETRCATRDGRVIDAVLRVSVLPDGRDWSRVLLMAVDVTERNEARAKIERSSADLAHAGRVSILGQLAGSITHEVNQPLAAIINYGKSGKRWLARPQPDLGEVAECLDKIITNGNRAADVVGRVRALARKTAPQASAVDIAALVQESVALVAREAATAATSVRIEQTGEPAPIVCDRVQVQQVIVNLLMNALQAMRGVSERPREIRVTIDGGADETVEIAVRDSGSGIDGDPNRIFDPFFTTKSDGMGLGLSICRTIIEGQGGRIQASNNPLHGATVAFTLPISIPAEARWRARPNILI
jgi:C4-dicarboxylate-specific signal transduction histidine kinase